MLEHQNCDNASQAAEEIKHPNRCHWLVPKKLQWKLVRPKLPRIILKTPILIQVTSQRLEEELHLSIKRFLKQVTVSINFKWSCLKAALVKLIWRAEYFSVENSILQDDKPVEAKNPRLEGQKENLKFLARKAENFFPSWRPSENEKASEIKPRL